MNVAQETLGFRRTGFSPVLTLLMSAFALLIPPASLTRHLHRLTERSSTIAHLNQAISLTISGVQLERLVRDGALYASRAHALGRQARYVFEIAWVRCAIRSFGVWLEPRYIFRAGRLDQ